MNKIEFGDCRETMRRWACENVKVQTCVTSPPYFGLRNYGGHHGQIGLEKSLDEYISTMVEVFQCVRDVLADDGTLWVNIGDGYGAGKQLLGVPWRLAFALQADGWILRQDIIWHKPNPMPESVQDRCTKAHEYIFLLSKSKKYYFNHVAIKQPIKGVPETRNKNAEGYQADYAHGDRFSKGERVFGADGMANKRNVWTVALRPYKGAHFAVYPPALIEPCILAGSKPNDIVLDPFMGSGTTAQVAIQHGRQYLGCELNPDYNSLQQERIAKAVSQQKT